MFRLLDIIYGSIPLWMLLIFNLTGSAYGQQRFRGSYRLFTTRDCASDLDVYRPNLIPTLWPEKVKSVEIKTIFNGKKSSLKVKWTAEIRNCKGFKIVLSPEDKPEICRILDYTQSIGLYSSGQFNFSFKFDRVYEQKLFTGKVFALPILDESSVELRNFTTIDCSKFVPGFEHTYNGKTMKVDFTAGPSLCHYKKYEIVVNHKNGSLVKKVYVPNEENKKILSVSFDLNICTGYYFILVGASETHRDKPSKCVCKNRDGYCAECLNAQSSPDYFIAAKSCVPEVRLSKETKPKPEPKFHLILLVIVGIISLMAVILTLQYFRLSHSKMVKKNGIVLFLDDHDYHTKAVSAVVDYLNNCHLDVCLASVFLRNHDFPDLQVVICEVLRSDFILLVLSSALKQRMQAWEQHQDYVEFFKDKNSNILSKPLLDIILACNRLYICKFDHTPEFGQWPTKCYSFPTDLKKMVTHLSEVKSTQRQICYDHSKSKTLWQKLKQSIEASHLFEETNPGWMQIKYPCPKNVAVSNLMIDDGKSQLDSVGEPEYITIAKMKEMYRDQYGILNSIPEQSISPPSIYTITISEKLKEFNEKNNL